MLHQYNPIGTTYTEILECLLSNGMIKLLLIRRVTENTWKPKIWHLNNYCEYHRARGHDTEGCQAFKNKIKSMFNTRELPLPKAT